MVTLSASRALACSLRRSSVGVCICVRAYWLPALVCVRLRYQRAGPGPALLVACRRELKLARSFPLFSLSLSCSLPLLPDCKTIRIRLGDDGDVCKKMSVYFPTYVYTCELAAPLAFACLWACRVCLCVCECVRVCDCTRSSFNMLSSFVEVVFLVVVAAAASLLLLLLLLLLLSVGCCANVSLFLYSACRCCDVAPFCCCVSALGIQLSSTSIYLE